MKGIPLVAVWAFTLFFVFHQKLFAADLHRNDPADGIWSEAANWNPRQIPAANGGALVLNDPLTVLAEASTCSPVVVNANDAGPGSLRAAIECANAMPGRDTISFNIPGKGVQTIVPLSPLPALTDPVVIDGYTQPNARPNSLVDGSDAVFLIELRGGRTVPPFANGLEIFTTNCLVRGLLINGFNDGIAVRVYSNGSLGIDLTADGVTPNDVGDADPGANNLQNFPVLASAVSGVGGTRIQGTLNSTPGTSFTIEFFANRECDPAGTGQGETFLGGTTVTTDGSGNAPVDRTVSTRVAGGQFITSTATDPGGNTSEFSPCVVVEGPALEPIAEAISPIELNPQTGLFEQTVRFSNWSTSALAAVSISIRDLPSDVLVYNASGTSNDVPFVQYGQSVPAGDSVDLAIEYYRLSRASFDNPNFASAVIQPATPPLFEGVTLALDRNPESAIVRVLIEFSSIPGDRYSIQYSGDMTGWKDARPPITAPGTRVQWLDDGPPKTESKPSPPGSRFYRVIVLPRN